MPRIAVTGATIIDTAPESPRPVRQTILVEDGRILDWLEPDMRPDAELVDASGCWAIPGLIDVHFVPFGSDDPAVPPHEISLVHHVHRVLPRLEDWLASGVTTACTMGVHDNLDFDLRDLLSAGRIRGPRLFASGCPIAAFTGGHWQHKNALLEVTGPDEARRAARQQIKAGADQLLLYAELDTSLPWAATAGWPNLDEDEIHAAVQEAHHASVPCCAVALSVSSIRRCANAGVHCLDRATALDRETIDLLARQGVAIVPTLSVHSPARTTPDRAEPGLLLRALRAGVPVATGTATSDMRCQLPAECQALVEVGFAPYEALQAATIHGAEALRRRPDLGSLERGRWADIVLLDANPLLDIANLTRVRDVLKAGQVQSWRKEV